MEVYNLLLQYKTIFKTKGYQLLRQSLGGTGYDSQSQQKCATVHMGNVLKSKQRSPHLQEQKHLKPVPLYQIYVSE